MSLPTVQELELSIMGFFVQLERDGRDRRGDGVVPVDEGTGLPISANDLAPAHRALYGMDLVLATSISPKRYARAMLFRSDSQGQTALAMIQPERWTAEEAGLVAALEQRVRLAIRNLAQRGILRDTPPIGPDGEPLPLDEAGFAQEAQITYSGLQEARRRVRGTRYERRTSVSILDCLPPHVRDKAPAYALAEWRQANRA